jgi:hypothetical protein
VESHVSAIVDRVHIFLALHQQWLRVRDLPGIMLQRAVDQRYDLPNCLDCPLTCTVRYDI